MCDRNWLDFALQITDMLWMSASDTWVESREACKTQVSTCVNKVTWLYMQLQAFDKKCLVPSASNKIARQHIAFPCFLMYARKIGKARSIWWCNRTRFEPWLCTSTHSLPQLVTWRSNDHAYCMDEWAGIRYHASNCIRLHDQINQTFLVFLVYVVWEGLGTRLGSKIM